MQIVFRYEHPFLKKVLRERNETFCLLNTPYYNKCIIRGIMADIKTPVLSLNSLEIDENGTSGTFIHLSGVVPGLINSILRFMGINGSTDLRMNASYLEMRTGNAKGQSSWFVPTGSLSSIQGGYQKDFGLLIMAVTTFIIAFIIDVFLAMEDGSFGFGVFTAIGFVFAIIMVIIYVFTKTMYFEIESGGGMSARIQFKGAIDINDVERALLIMQALIAKAQYDGEVIVMGKLATMAIPKEQIIIHHQADLQRFPGWDEPMIRSYLDKGWSIEKLDEYYQQQVSQHNAAPLIEDENNSTVPPSVESESFE